MVNQLSELEKLLYNKHLAVSRSIKNKPFKLKRDFTDLIGTDKHKHLKRISILFSKHPEIQPDIFFKAPYVLYPDVNYFGLDYFSTLRAIKSYTIYKNTLFLQNPDEQIERIKDSLKFIADFCIQHNLYLHQYSLHKTADVYTWMKHLKENKINVYCLFGFSNIFSSLSCLTSEMQYFFAESFIENFQKLHTLYNNSNLAKKVVQNAFQILSKFIESRVVKS